MYSPRPIIVYAPGFIDYLEIDWNKGVNTLLTNNATLTLGMCAHLRGNFLFLTFPRTSYMY